jgi:hypothetical protein
VRLAAGKTGGGEMRAGQRRCDKEAAAVSDAGSSDGGTGGHVLGSLREHGLCAAGDVICN